jgi:hypothetical protein
MSKGALTWVEIFWSYNAKVINYWIFFSINIHKIINKICIQIQRCNSCCWNVVIESNLMKFIS